MRPRRRDPQRAAGGGQAERSLRYRNLLNPFEPVRIFSDDHIESMHVAALGIIERQGMRVLSAGGPAMVAARLTKVPAEVTLIGRAPARSCRVGGHNVVLAPVAGPPSVSDLERGKRTGSTAAFRDFVRPSR